MGNQQPMKIIHINKFISGIYKLIFIPVIILFQQLEFYQ